MNNGVNFVEMVNGEDEEQQMTICVVLVKVDYEHFSLLRALWSSHSLINISFSLNKWGKKKMSNNV
jgi:hypothetical protein